MGRRFFSKNPALAAYLGSLINLDLIRSTEEQTEDNEEDRELTFEDLELSELGQRVADAYGRAVRNVTSAGAIAESDICVAAELREWGKRGGLCELRQAQAPDREVLRELFFNPHESSKAHLFRRQTLLLLMHFADECAAREFHLDAGALNDATYFGHLVDWSSDDAPVPVVWPDALSDIALRWRFYHFHYFCWFALESLFAAVVAEAGAADVAGVELATLFASLECRGGTREVAEALGLDVTVPLAKLTPRELWAACGFPEDPTTSAGSERWDVVVGARHILSEGRLELALRQKAFSFGASVLLGVVLLLSSLMRYRRWEDTGYGDWLFGHAESDSFLDVTTPQVLRFLRQDFPDFTRVPLAHLAASVLRRFVIQQHQAMAFTKSHDGSRAFFHTDQDRIFVRAEKAWQPKQDNGRLRSAVRILTDLGYVEEDAEIAGIFRRTNDGSAYLKRALAARA